MPKMPAKELVDPCRECREAESILTQRNRRLCKECYKRVVDYKVLRRMENYRLRKTGPQTGPLNLLLPLSYGISSSVLLQLLHTQIERQLAKPHAPAPYNLHVLVIDPSTISPSSPSHEEGFELAKQCFPQFSFTRIPFHSIFDLVPDIHEIMSQYAGGNFVDNPSLSHKERLDAFRASISTATSKADVEYVLMTRLIVAFAKQKECWAIIWGDSDKRLAAKTLANVAKGRGAAITWQVTDGMSPFGLEFNFPLRDLFSEEVHNYATFFPELEKIIIRDAPPSENTLTKNLSIDELMMRYVQTHGAKYPGVMWNVTRTAGKLQSSSKDSAAAAQCTFCGAHMSGPEANSNGFCYGCERSRPDLNC